MSSDTELITILDKTFNDVNRSTREKISEIIKDPLFVPVYDVSIRNQKELAQQRLKRIAKEKVVSVKDFRTDPENIFTMHELLSLVDGSLATKFTVQFNLFGGTLIGLGTERHEKYIEGIDSLETTGCFCLTELGYGNNAIEMETTAVWDDTEKKFTINTPTVSSQKYWITNGAYYANYGLVFAQTIVKSKNEGINVFLVRLRDENMNLCKGVTIDDMGHKMSLNGIDNARIIFKNVKVDRTEMLNRISELDEMGNFTSSITGIRQRFISAANRLLSGRICIASMMISGTKSVLAITNKYATTRLSNGKSGKSDTPIAEYQLFQNQIVPLLSKCVVYNVALLAVRKVYSDFCLNPQNFNNDQFNEIVRLCCVIKPIISWNANEVANICRERCGGQGFLSINRIESFIAGSHSGITVEGDSAVLMQKVSKEYVEDFVKKIVEPPKISRCPIKMIEIFNLETLFNLIKLRESKLLESLAEKTVDNMDNLFKTWMLEESDLIQSLAMIHGERYCLESAINHFSTTKNEIIQNILLLFAAITIRKYLSWYLMNDYILAENAQKFGQKINDLIKLVGKHSTDICEAFKLPKHAFYAPIYTGVEDYYKSDITGGEHYNIPLRPKF